MLKTKIAAGQLLSIPQVCAFLSMSRRTVYRRMEARGLARLRSFKDGRLRRVRAADLLLYIKRTSKRGRRDWRD